MSWRDIDDIVDRGVAGSIGWKAGNGKTRYQPAVLVDGKPIMRQWFRFGAGLRVTSWRSEAERYHLAPYTYRSRPRAVWKAVRWLKSIRSQAVRELESCAPTRRPESRASTLSMIST